MSLLEFPRFHPLCEDLDLFCTKCGAQISAQTKFCSACGSPVVPTEYGRTDPSTAAAAPAPGAARYPFVPAYWQVLFAKFDQNPTTFQTHWNWPAFFFGAFWYLVKGMPAKAALYFVLSIVTAGVGWVFLAIYAGLYGAWDYYLKEVQGKQFW